MAKKRQKDTKTPLSVKKPIKPWTALDIMRAGFRNAGNSNIAESRRVRRES